jgi:hypothetical protein
VTGWQRLKLVLSVLWWLFAAFAAWVVGHNTMDGSTEWQMVWFVLGSAAVVYAIAAAIWWAFAGFSKRSQ